MKIKLLLVSRVVLLLLMLTFAGCKDDEKTPQEEYDVMLNETSLGPVLSDKNGRTLYFFTKDATGNSVCSGNCLENWPVFTIPGNLRLGTGLDADDFGTITRGDGTKQVTYKNWPLYHYAQDMAKGDVKGDNVGKIWFVAKTDYTVMLVNNQLVGMDGKSYKSDYTEGEEETQYLVDDWGRTLYGFKNDRYNVNKFTKEDLSNEATWPIYTAEIKSVPSELDKADFAVINVFNRKQLTYKGWPLYYFGADSEERGVTKGVSVPQPGIWPVLQKNMAEATEE
jgi:predicted lipoprotein with Yx(FWY)xxD motif